jgi:hypothetical protein
VKRYIFALIVAIALCVLGLVPIEIQATEIWSDNFNDGNYDGWTIDTDGFPGGDFSAANGVLNVTVVSGMAPWGYYSSGIWHPSTVSTGTWEFDLIGKLHSLTQFSFLYNVSLGSWDPAQGYNFAMTISDTGVAIVKLNRADSDTSESAIDMAQVDPAKESNIYHIEISRHADGHFYVWVDDVLTLEAVDTTYSISTDLIYAASLHCAIDNVVVSDTVKTPTTATNTTTTGTTTTTQLQDMTLIYLAAGGAVVLVIVIAIIIKRR